jgi:phage terminase large subunit
MGSTGLFFYMAEIIYNTRLFNPLFWHIMPLLHDPKIRYIYIEGGSGASKTFCIADALSIYLAQTGSSTMCFRRFGVHIKDSVYKTFKLAQERLELKRYFDYQEFAIKYPSLDGQIRFRGLDDDENIKGIEDFDIIYPNEWNQQTQAQWDQLRKRLRGRPNQKFICDWNPVSSQLWIYSKWLDLDEWTDLPLHIDNCESKYNQLDPEHSFKRINKKGNAVWFKITFRDNYWIVGHPSGKGGYVDQESLDDFEWDRIHRPNFYRVYANGERGIVRTGGEFWKQFDEQKHIKPVKYTKSTIHLSVDENVNPYVTVSCWQFIQKEIRQIHELPCKTPDNNAVKAALKTVAWLRSIGHEDVVFVYGDPSGNKRSTIDENSRSFFDKFIEVLRNGGFTVVNRVAKSAPQVALSASFINEIYESNLFGYSITIADHCKVSIDDYCTVKEDVDGSMKKPKQKDKETEVTYEPHGHFSDAKRYLIIKALEQFFRLYKTRNKRGGGSIAV